MGWEEKIELLKAIGRANEKFDLTRHEEPMPKPAAELIAKELKKSKWLSRYSDMILEAKSIAVVNRILERVFNDADLYRVWCGKPDF